MVAARQPRIELVVAQQSFATALSLAMAVAAAGVAGWVVLAQTMHVRSAGASKKGRNLVYGSRYARVVLGTWWREGCPRPVADDAPALQSPHRR